MERACIYSLAAYIFSIYIFIYNVTPEMLIASIMISNLIKNIQDIKFYWIELNNLEENEN